MFGRSSRFGGSGLTCGFCKSTSEIFSRQVHQWDLFPARPPVRSFKIRKTWWFNEKWCKCTKFNQRKHKIQWLQIRIDCYLFDLQDSLECDSFFNKYDIIIKSMHLNWPFDANNIVIVMTANEQLKLSAIALRKIVFAFFIH